MEIKDVGIHQSNTTSLEIPSPGFITFAAQQPGAGSLYRLSSSGDQLWVLNLQENKITQGIYLQPGSYRVIFRRKDLKSIAYSIIEDFLVLEGTPATIKLY